MNERNEQVTFQNLKDCAAAHKEALEENRTLQAQLAAAERVVGELRGALDSIDQLRKRLPDPDFGEQRTTAKAIGEIVQAALARLTEWEGTR